VGRGELKSRGQRAQRAGAGAAREMGGVRAAVGCLGNHGLRERACRALPLWSVYSLRSHTEQPKALDTPVRLSKPGAARVVGRVLGPVSRRCVRWLQDAQRPLKKPVSA